MVRFDSGRICLDLLATGAYDREQLAAPHSWANGCCGAGLLPAGHAAHRGSAATGRPGSSNCAAASASWSSPSWRGARRRRARRARPRQRPRGRATPGRTRDPGRRRRTRTHPGAAPPSAARCSPSSPGTPSTCSPTPRRGPCCASARATPAGCSTSTPRAGAGAAGVRARCAATASGWPATGAAWPRSEPGAPRRPRPRTPEKGAAGFEWLRSTVRMERRTGSQPRAGWSRPGGAGCARMPPWPMTVRAGPGTAPCPTRS